MSSSPRLLRLLRGRTRDLVLLVVLAAALVGVHLATSSDDPDASSKDAQGAAVDPASTAPAATESAAPAPVAPGGQGVHAAGPPLQLLPELTCIPQTKQATLRVMTYNIKSAHFGGYSRLNDIAADLEAADPDVVILQEVDKNRYTTGRVDESSILSGVLGYQASFGANVLRPGNSEYGTAILSRFPIVSTDNVLLPNRPGMQQRGLLRVSLEIKGIPLNIYDTHLQHTSRSMRDDQIAAIVAQVGEDPVSKILGGDLNDTPASSVLQKAYTYFNDTWSTVGAGFGHTAPAGNPRARIDYLLYQQGTDADTTLTPLSAEVLGVGSSDHRAMMATYSLETKAEPVCVPTT